MPKKFQSKRDSIKALISYGFTDSDIASTLHLSEQSGYIRKIRREVANAASGNEHPKSNKPKLTPELYYNAMKKNNETKESLANDLGVSRMTLHRFEQDSEMKKRLARYLRVRGMSIAKIAEQICTKISTLEEMGIDKLPTLESIKMQIGVALEPLADVAQWDDEVAALFYQWKSVSERLK